VLVYVKVLAAIAIVNYCVPPKNNQFRNIFTFSNRFTQATYEKKNVSVGIWEMG
jgi:hypothetical protein